MGSILKATAAVIFTVGPASALAQDGAADFSARDAVRGFLTDADTLGATTATVGSVGESADGVVARDVAMSWTVMLGPEAAQANMTLNIAAPEVRVNGLEPQGDGHAVALVDAPLAELDFVVEGPERELFRYDLTSTDFRMEDASWGAIPTIANDPTRPVSRFGPLLDWSAGFSYASNSVARIFGTAVFTEGGEELSRQDIEYGPMSVGPVENGRLEAYEYGPMTSTQVIEGIDGEEITMELNYGAQRGEGIDIKPLVAAFTGNGDTGSGTFAESIVVDGVTVTAGNLFNMEIGPVTVEDFNVDTSAGPILEKLDPFVIAAVNETEPDPAGLMELILDLYGVFGFGRYAIEEMSANGPDFAMELGGVAAEGVSRNGLERFSLSDLAVRAPGTDLSLGSFVLADAAFPERDLIMSLMAQSMTGAVPDPNAFMGLIPTLGEISVGELRTTVPGAIDPLEVGEARLTLTNDIPPIPTGMDLTLSGFSMPASLIPDVTTIQTLSGLGADPVSVDGNISLRWDEDTQRMEFSEDVTVANVGRLQSEATLSGVPRSLFENPQLATAAMTSAALNSINLRFTNEGVADYFINLMSQQSGVSQEDFAEAMGTQAQIQVSMFTGSQELATTVSDAVRAFLTDPRSLSISANPDVPVNFAELIGAAMTAPDAIPGLLNLTLTANE